eukprot:7985412-Pyramimonas_sp.AAC.1
MIRKAEPTVRERSRGRRVSDVTAEGIVFGFGHHQRRLDLSPKQFRDVTGSAAESERYMYSPDGPVRCRKRGYILPTDQSRRTLLPLRTAMNLPPHRGPPHRRCPQRKRNSPAASPHGYKRVTGRYARVTTVTTARAVSATRGRSATAA